MTTMKNAQVIYYLCREATMEHPHSIDVAYLECNGLLLKDVKRRLVSIRGKRMPDMYAWSYKRSYKNDYIWHDVSDNDEITPTSDEEYILKGSEIVHSGCVFPNADEQCDEGKIHCKVVLKEVKLRNITDPPELSIIDPYKHKPASEQHSTDESFSKAVIEQHRLSSSHRGDKPVTPRLSSSRRGDKPLPDKKKLSPVHLNVETTCIPETCETPKKGQVLNLKQIFPCEDVRVENKMINKQQENASKSVLSSCSISWKKIGDKLVPHKFNGTTPSSGGQEYLYKQGSVTPVKYQQQRNSVSRYRPRHSFSNSEYFDGYDMYLKPELWKDAEVSRRSSTESARTYSGEQVCSKYVASPKNSVSNHIISRLVQANEAEKVVWWNDVPTPKQVNEDSRKLRNNKLDWEKNLQQAVDMIINPP